MPGPDLDIARNVKALEWVKAELVNALSGLFQALLKGDKEMIIDNLALLVINSFLLLKRMGISFGQLELRVYDKTACFLREGHKLEEWYGDLSALKNYLNLKR